MKIKANGIEMNYEITGTGDCLVLIHGFSDNLTMWYNQVPEFSKTYQVLTYDVRGFGKTERPAGPYAMDFFADDLHELLNALGIKAAAVLGYSMGGRIALEFCIKYPQKAKAMIFANSVVGAPRPPDAEQRSKMMLEMIQKGDNDTISEQMTVNSFSAGFKEKDPATFRKYKDVKLQNDPAGYIPAMMGMGAAALVPVDLNLIRCPALILAGTMDNFMSIDVAHDMHHQIPGSTLKVFPTGHVTAIETPIPFNEAVMDFMKQIC